MKKLKDKLIVHKYLNIYMKIVQINLVPHLHLIKANVNPITINYLDLEINVINDKMIITVHDKRSYFYFNVIKAVLWSSNASKSIL